MVHNLPSKDHRIRPSQKTLRLTFRVAGGEVHLVRQEHLNKITPPSFGERPQAGKHGGFWLELRDASDRVLDHCLLHSPLGDSVCIHSPDGTIRREFGPVSENIFEVLLPDRVEASAVALVGEYLDTAKAGTAQTDEVGQSALGARELARFELAKRDQTGGVLSGGER